MQIIWFCIHKNHNDSTKKLLELINKFSKVVRHKINIQKSAAFLYTNNETSEKEITTTIPFTISSKISRLKFKEVKDLCKKKKKMQALLKEIKEHANEKISCVYGSEDYC